MLKLSECVKTSENPIFLYGKELVGIQYVLGCISRGETLPEIQLVKNDENFNFAMSAAVGEMYNDSINGIEKEEYKLPNLNSVPVEVDITKNDIVVRYEILK